MRDLLVAGAPIFITVRVGDGASWDRFDDDESVASRFMRLFEPDRLTWLVPDARFEVEDTWIEYSIWGRPSRWISLISTKSP